jgi:MYXO-CTERM domain-containing protein
MHRFTQLMIQLVAIMLLVTASPTLADSPGRVLLHTNQEDLVRHSNQESGWQQILSEPRTMMNYFPSPPMDLTEARLRDLLPVPLSHGNSPRITTLPAGSIPTPGVMVLLGLAGLLGAPTRRRRPCAPTNRPAG